MKKFILVILSTFLFISCSDRVYVHSARLDGKGFYAMSDACIKGLKFSTNEVEGIVEEGYKQGYNLKSGIYFDTINYKKDGKLYTFKFWSSQNTARRAWTKLVLNEMGVIEDEKRQPE